MISHLNGGNTAQPPTGHDEPDWTGIGWDGASPDAHATAWTNDENAAYVEFAWAFHDNRTAQQRLAEARRLFVEKFGVEPVFCLCNDQTAATLGAPTDGPTIHGFPFIREYELRLGAPAGAP